MSVKHKLQLRRLKLSTSTLTPLGAYSKWNQTTHEGMHTCWHVLLHSCVSASAPFHSVLNPEHLPIAWRELSPQRSKCRPRHYIAPKQNNSITALLHRCRRRRSHRRPWTSVRWRLARPGWLTLGRLRYRRPVPALHGRWWAYDVMQPGRRSRPPTALSR